MEHPQPQETTQTESKPKKFRRIKKILLVSGITFLIILVTGIILANVYEKEIKKYAVDKINTYLKAELKVNEENISFSFFKKFPKASLNFNNLLIQSENHTDTILHAQNFSLEFGIGSVISGNYAVNEIGIEKAIINLNVDKKGKEEYIFWKESESADTTSKFQFNLNEVSFNQVQLNYRNQKTKVTTLILLEKTTFSGAFSSDTSEISINSSHFIKEISQDSSLFFENKKSSLSIEQGKFTSNFISLKQGKIKIEEMELDLSCVFDIKNKNSTLSAIASNVEISDVFSLMPKEVNEKLKEYKTKGKVNGDIQIVTKKNKQTPVIKTNFKIKNGTITEKNSGVKLSNLILNGNFSSSKNTQRLELVEGTGEMEGGEINLSGKMLGKNIKTIFYKLKGSFDLKELGEFLQIKAIEKMSGSLVLDNSFQGRVTKQNDISVSKFTGTATLNNAFLKLKDKEHSYENFTADIKFNRFTTNANFEGNYGKTDLILSTQLSNLFPYLFSEKELIASVYLQSELMELDKLLGNEKEEVNNGEDTVGVSFPKRIQANIRAKIGKLSYDKHELTNLSGTISMSQKGVNANNLTFSGNGGSYSISGKLDKKGEGFELNSSIIGGQIKISDFLKRFDNFGQTVLRHDHLSGRANVIISLHSSLSKHLELDLNTLDSKIEFSIANGELKNLELFQEMGEYLKSNLITRGVIKVEELSKKLTLVKFSEFTNTLILKNRKITLPNMQIKTSAMDIGIYGSQTFDYDINYGINLRLTDIMTKKKESEYGYIVDDGTGTRLFLLMTGNIDAPIFKLDKEGRKNYLENKRETEKNNVKGILKDEFGLFKKDKSAKTTPKKDKAKPKFEIDWEEKKEEKKPKEEEPKEKKKRSWLEKLKKKKEKKEKPDFEVE